METPIGQCSARSTAAGTARLIVIQIADPGDDDLGRGVVGARVAHAHGDLPPLGVLADFVVLGQTKQELVIGDCVIDDNGSCSAASLMA